MDQPDQLNVTVLPWCFPFENPPSNAIVWWKERSPPDTTHTGAISCFSALNEAFVEACISVPVKTSEEDQSAFSDCKTQLRQPPDRCV